MIDLFDLRYLASGTRRQRCALAAIERPGIWRDLAPYTPALAGTIPLDFGATPVCDPGKMCPALAFDVTYSVTVS